MLESCQNARERWGGLHLMIDRWLQERHELVLLFEGLNSDQHAPAANADDLKGFCELLVDYVSAGHFEIYQQLLQEARTFDDQRGLELARKIYPRIEAITQIALTFNDHCDNGDCRESKSLQKELEQLGQLMEERFELEDCLIEVLHNAHQQEALQKA